MNFLLHDFINKVFLNLLTTEFQPDHREDSLKLIKPRSIT